MREATKARSLLYRVLQWTWGLPQNLAGGLLYLILRGKGRETFRYGMARGVKWSLQGSMGLGMFIFFGHDRSPRRENVLVHEYGHTLQSAVIGPLFLPVVGLPSVLWANLPVFIRMRRKGRRDYDDFYPEKWADIWGEKETGLPSTRILPGSRFGQKAKE